ncbi:MarR family transcriptional regulator [Halostagnicola sp. A56]|uniref:helix-turn-helix transcriptional regulator n=1 Tax=Halostagnicola sp. A56 TaxID=1495067 RepID=UPI00049EB2A9|nr:helix-turn-helix domain-containing protein [Halostagnicola sp. A56]
MPLIQLVRSISVWESALIVVLFVLIAALVGVRVTTALSDREVSVSPQRPSEDDRREAPPEDEPPATESPAYESVVSAETPPELLSDEGQVVRLLVENHGRIRQHEIADETGWSKSKVSRTLSKMHDNGTIEKTSLGRENVITLAEVDANDPNQSDSDNVGNPVA